MFHAFIAQASLNPLPQQQSIVDLLAKKRADQKSKRKILFVSFAIALLEEEQQIMQVGFVPVNAAVCGL